MILLGGVPGLEMHQVCGVGLSASAVGDSGVVGATDWRGGRGYVA